MYALRRRDRGISGFFDRFELSLYPQAQLNEEIAFLAYYLHWGHDELMELGHRERRQWCEQVSAINRKLSGTANERFEFK
ncbi:MAG: hypothetical protein LBJ99_01240 [Oscillospiraceae bacterium]|nr:hypothetical protein [Oscillospiraceae bacterium]